jgi:hypothetical protein
MYPAKSKGSDHVDAFSDCLVDIHDGQRGCLRSRHRPGSDDSSTRGLRVRGDPSRRCSELFGQRAGVLVHRSHAAVAISEGSFSLVKPDRLRGGHEELGSRAAGRRTKDKPYSITSSARASSVGGTVRPSALAVLRLIISSYLVGSCTGRSRGFSPLRIRSA